jgi:hypothetical protein
MAMNTETGRHNIFDAIEVPALHRGTQFRVPSATVAHSPEAGATETETPGAGMSPVHATSHEVAS